MTNEERKQLLQEAKDLGLKSITIDGIKYEFKDDYKAPSQEVNESESVKLAEQLAKTPFDSITDEEILFWSTPYYDEIQENKKKLAEQAKDKEQING